MTAEERNNYVDTVQKYVDVAKDALQKIAEISDGKDGNVIFLALHKKDDLDTIVKCAKINT